MSSKFIFGIGILLVALNVSGAPELRVSPKSVGGCFGTRPTYMISAMMNASPVPSLSTRAFEKVFSVLRDFTPEPVEFVVETSSLAFDALAVYDNGNRKIHMMLGLLLARGMDEDALALIACHELGHHFGGKPSYETPPLSYEGQADFYANRSCFSHWMANTTAVSAVDETAKDYCSNILRSTDANCARSMTTALKITKIVAQRFQVSTTELPLFDGNIVNETIKTHASPQCRLDTMKSAYACHAAGTCETSEARPACWYTRPVTGALARGP